jgi:hypothetical protein
MYQLEVSPLKVDNRKYKEYGMSELSPKDNLSAAFEGIDNAYLALQECLCSIAPKAPEPKPQPESITQKEPSEIPWLKDKRKSGKSMIKISRMESEAMFHKIGKVYFDKEITDRLWQMEAANNKITLLGAMYRIRVFLHELSQPLASMNLATDLLSMDLGDDKQMLEYIELVSTLSTGMESLLEIISKIRWIARETTKIGSF